MSNLVEHSICDGVFEEPTHYHHDAQNKESEGREGRRSV